MTAFATLRDSLALLRTKRFGTFWFASLLSSIGTWTQQIAEPWLLLTLGASPFLIGLDSFAGNAPVLALTLVGGALADRADRRRVIALFQSLQMLCPLTIVVLLASGTVKPWMIVALSLVVGVTDALSMPSFQSIVPSIVERDQIGRGLALNATQFSLSRILGPSIAGVLMASAGAMACFVVSALSYIPFIGVALWILPPWIRPQTTAETPRARHPFEGLGEILRDRMQRGALSTVLASGFLSAPLMTFIPVLIKDGFGGDASRFSIAVAAFGAGGLLGALALLSIGPGVDRRKLASGFAIARGVFLVLLATTPWYWSLPPILALAGASMTISNTASNTMLQATSSPKLLGQAVSLYMLAMRGGMSLGALGTGAVVGALGIRTTFLVSGVLAIGVQLILARSWGRATRPV